jgi:hypothetical protein
MRINHHIRPLPSGFRFSSVMAGLEVSLARSARRHPASFSIPQKERFFDPMRNLLIFVELGFVICTIGCSDHVLRGKEVASQDGKSYLTVDELDGPTCRAPTVDGKHWLFPVHVAGPIAPGEHEIRCAEPIKFVVRPGITFHFEYWGP